MITNESLYERMKEFADRLSSVNLRITVAEEIQKRIESKIDKLNEHVDRLRTQAAYISGIVAFIITIIGLAVKFIK